MDISIIFTIVILILSVVIHEVAHGYAALALGDVTAKYAGRLTLNPIKHLDPVGSIILPFVLAILPGGFIFGWAKPVPYNPYNLRNKRWGELIVAIAGPLSNVAVAVLLGFIIRYGGYLSLSTPFITLALTAVVINLVLAVFNLVPIPPLDGSKILFGLFPRFADRYKRTMERYGLIFLLVFIILFSDIIIPVVLFLARIITGLPL